MKFQPSCVQLGWLAVIFGGLSVLVAEAQALEKAKLRVKFHAIQFSEHGDAEEGAAVFAGHFPIHSARCIEARVVFEHLRGGEGAFSNEVRMWLYGFDNRLISAQKKVLKMASDWESGWVSQSFGWSEAGRWSVGTYRVKVWLAGERVGEAAFYLEDEGKVLPARVSGITVKDLAFYEGGGFFRPVKGERSATSFARSEVRRIYWVVEGKNERTASGAGAAAECAWLLLSPRWHVAW